MSGWYDCTSLNTDFLLLSISFFSPQINRTLDKVNALREALVNGIKTNCNCSITADYIGNGQLVCFEAITFRGQIFSTDTHDDTVLLSLLQEWVSTSPMVIVEGETLQVLGNCRVELEHLDSNETYCTVSATFPIYTLISSIAAGIVAILMVLGLIVGCYVCYRKGGMCHRKAGIVHNKSKKRYMISCVCTVIKRYVILFIPRCDMPSGMCVQL